MARRAEAGKMAAKLRATGSDGAVQLPVQLLMGDVLHGLETPKILGKHTMRIRVPNLDDYTQLEKLQLEREALGFALSRNEMELHRAWANKLGAVPSNRLVRHAEREVTVAGLLVAGRSHMAKESDLMLFATIQDEYGLVEAVLFPDSYKENSAVIANNGSGPYLVKGKVQVTGKGRGIGLQPPADLKLAAADAVILKVHPVLIVSELKPLGDPSGT
jgi:DNA polymerase III alpha subunit